MDPFKEGAPWIGDSMKVGATMVVEKRVVRARITGQTQETMEEMKSMTKVSK